MYSVQLTGAMATNAALLLITNIQNLTKRLDLGIVTLFLQKISESNYDNQKIAVQTEILVVIVTLSTIIATLLHCYFCY